MPARLSSGLGRTKQLKSVTAWPVPAPDRMRPPGRNLKSCMAASNRSAQVRWSAAVGSAPATA